MSMRTASAAIATCTGDSGIPEDDAVVGAWNTEQIQEFVHEMPRALILHSSGEPDHRNFDWFRTIGVRGFEVGEVWPPGFIRGAHAAGMAVFAYTINDAGTMRRLIRMGVDAIETDDPELALAIRDRDSDAVRRYCDPMKVRPIPVDNRNEDESMGRLSEWFSNNRSFQWWSPPTMRPRS